MNATMATIEERVRRGAMLLDSTTPGWAHKINQDALDMFDCFGCVLGQLFGYYPKARNRIFDDPSSVDGPCKPTTFARSIEHGFHASNCQVQIAEYAALRTAWLAEIRLRLAPDDDATETEAGELATAEAPTR